jgi:hypothetical protein
MSEQLERTTGGSWAGEMQGAIAHPVVLAGSAFVLGLVAGLFLKDGARHVYERARRGRWHREYERTVTYDDNLPDSLGRREPAPHPGQSRFGGTGAIGVSPASVVPARPEETKPQSGR